MTQEMNNLNKKVNIIGAGASGIFLTLELLKKGYAVDLYDQSGGILKKFLIAGKGGLNLTHSEDLSTFVLKYGKNQNLFKKYLDNFSPDHLREWLLEFGVPTYIGSSKRVFPENKTAGEILKIWLSCCEKYQTFNFKTRHKFVGFEDGVILEDNKGQKLNLGKENIVFGLGGGSYTQTGSDGSWIDPFKSMDIKVNPFHAINCGYEITWSDDFIEKNAHKPLKNILLKLNERELRGEILFTEYGIEGSAIYALSRNINQEITLKTKCSLTIDLKPDMSLEQLKEKLTKPRNKNSQVNFLRKTINIDGVALELLKNCTTKDQFSDNLLLADKIKNCSIELIKSRPLEEAISTAGGVCFTEMNNDLGLKKFPKIYVMGEMLDWDAPTGGYLLQGCFSMAAWIATHLN